MTIGYVSHFHTQVDFAIESLFYVLCMSGEFTAHFGAADNPLPGLEPGP